MPFVDAFPEPTIATDSSESLSFIFDILPVGYLDGLKYVWLPRVKVGSTEVRVRDRVTWSDSESEMDISVQFTLVDETDAALFTSTANVEIGVGKIVAGVWDTGSFITVLSNAHVNNISRSIEGPPDNPKDKIDITVISKGEGKLAKTSHNGLIIYDSNSTSIADLALIPKRDTDGNFYIPEVIAVPGLKLSNLFEEVFITKCGFSYYHTDLPEHNYPVERYEVKMGERFYDGLKPYIGPFFPAVTMTEDDGIWVTDTTLVQPTGFPSARRITLDRPESEKFTTKRQFVNALNLNYTGLQNNYDYTTFKFEYPITVNGATRTETERITIEFRKITSPTTNVVVREAVNIENLRTFLNDVEVDSTSDAYEFDEKGRFAHRRKTTQKKLPPISDVSMASFLQNVLVETDELIYEPHPFKPLADFISRRTYRSEGYVTSNSVNPRPDGNAFKMDYATSHRSGNVTTDDVFAWEDIKTREELSDPQRDGTTKTRAREVDEVTGLVTYDDVQSRVGEVAISGAHTSNDTILVFPKGTIVRNTDYIEEFNAGPVPLKYAIPLARRRLVQLQSDEGTVEVPIFGFDPSLKKGLLIECVDRDDVSLGNYVVTGRQYSVSLEEGFVTTLSARRVEGASSDYSLEDIGHHDRVIDSAQQLTYQLPIYCVVGYGLAIDPTTVPHLTIEARHGTSGAWTNLSVSELDLSAWDGTSQDFQVRVTAGTVTVLTREMFVLVKRLITIPSTPTLLSDGVGDVHGSTTITFSVTTPFGNNKILLVALGNRNQGIPTGVTYNGVGMTALSGSLAAIGTRLSLWYMVDPPEGVFNVVATYAISQLDVVGIGEVWSNVDQTTPFTDTFTDAAGGVDPDYDVSAFTGEMIVDFMNKWGEIFTVPSHAPTPGPNQTAIIVHENSSDQDQWVSSSYAAGGSTTDMSWTLSPSVGDSNYSQIIIGLKRA